MCAADVAISAGPVQWHIAAARAAAIPLRAPCWRSDRFILVVGGMRPLALAARAAGYAAVASGPSIIYAYHIVDPSAIYMRILSTYLWRSQQALVLALVGLFSSSSPLHPGALIYMYISVVYLGLHSQVHSGMRTCMHPIA